MNFFCFHTCTAKARLGKIEHVNLIGVTSHFAYVKLRITLSILAIPLDFEIARLDAIVLQTCH